METVDVKLPSELLKVANLEQRNLTALVREARGFSHLVVSA